MVPRPARILCVGDDSDLLLTRCAVLGKAGYETRSATVSEAEILLRMERYDLVIVSAFLSLHERHRTVSGVGDGPVLVLNGLTLAPELLALVEARLACLKM
jgi:hypothetical protein